MTFTLTVEMGSAAFEDNPAELARILRDLTEILPEGEPLAEAGQVRDANGNTVGSWSFE